MSAECLMKLVIFCCVFHVYFNMLGDTNSQQALGSGTERLQCEATLADNASVRKRKRTARATTSQTQALVDKLAARRFLATRRFTGLQGRENYESAWREVAEEINNLNGAIKTPEQWITVWRDMKSRACTKDAKFKKMRAETGNREINIPPLTELEKKVISLVGVDYTIGTNCPDSMPEDDVTQRELEASSIVVDVEDPLNIERADTEIVDVEFEVEEILPQTPQIATTSRVLPETPTERQVPPRRKRNLNPRRSVAEQHNSARADFLAVAESNAESMRMLAAAAKQQAEAAKMQAEAAKMQAEAAKMQAEASLLFAQAANKVGDALIKLIEK